MKLVAAYLGTDRGPLKRRRPTRTGAGRGSFRSVRGYRRRRMTPSNTACIGCVRGVCVLSGPPMSMTVLRFAGAPASGDNLLARCNSAAEQDQADVARREV